MSHFRNYRTRYINKEGQQKPIDIPGDKVLSYIQSCFENCAKKFAVHSPAVSCSSSSTLEQDQDEFPLESKEKEQPEPEMCVPNECNAVPCLPSPNNKDKCPDENAPEDDEESSIRDFQEDYIDVLSLGSPVLLQVDEKCEKMFCSHEDLFTCSVEHNRDVAQSEMCPASKETKELLPDETKCSAASSNPNRRPESQAALEAVTTSFTHRNAANIDPEDDCEFLIEESFGMFSSSWISASQKKQKPQRKNVISAPSKSKKEANKPRVRKKYKKTSEKPVPPSLVNQTKLKSTNVAETTVDGLKNVSRTHEIMSLIDDQPSLVLNTFQVGRRKIHSKNMASAEISNTTPADINQTEDHVALLEENVSASVQSQPVLRTEELSSNCKETVKHKHSKTKTSVERQNEENQEKTPNIMGMENHQPFENIGTYSDRSGSVLSPILSVKTSEQKSSNKNSQPVGLKSHNKKRLKKKNTPRTAQSKKQPQTQLSAIKDSVIRPTGRKKKVLVSDESSETEHEDERCDKGAENSYSYKLRKINRSREASQKRRQASLISSEDSDCERVSYHEDSFYLTEERLYPSEKRSKSTTDSSQYSPIPDVNANNTSGPLVDRKKSSKHEETFDSKELNSDDSRDFIDSLDGLTSNTLKRKLVLPTNTPNVRRTKRLRIKPLEYWRGERVKYKTRPSGGLVINGIISPEQTELRKPKKNTNPVVELDNMPESFLQGPSQPAVVFDAVSNREILLQCVNSGTSHLHFIDNEALSIYKYLTTPSFSAGKMILKPLKEKGYQYSHTDTLVFHITKGKLLLTLYDQYYYLTVGDYFFVPPENVYNIRNLLNKECIILFTQLKGKRSESE
ncbi:centromere protein C [Anolis sagrei]|uniref:centromere protein C n=1 Tax=Anolis sagrei TaxID=38937 RepID=UPI003522FAF2